MAFMTHGILRFRPSVRRTIVPLLSSRSFSTFQQLKHGASSPSPSLGVTASQSTMATSTEPDTNRQMIDSIIDYWYGQTETPSRYAVVSEEIFNRWFKSGKDVDDEIRAKFGANIENALAGDYDEIAVRHPDHGIRGTIAVIVLLDQFTRNVYRGTAKAFAGDEKAKRIVDTVWNDDDCQQLPFLWRNSLILPWMHNETMVSQEKSCDELAKLLEQLTREEQDSTDESIAACKKVAEMTLAYGHKHKDIVAQFGRFPHRNKALGRESTEAEEAYLKDGDRFGQ